MSSSAVLQHATGPGLATVGITRFRGSTIFEKMRCHCGGRSTPSCVDIPYKSTRVPNHAMPGTVSGR